MNLKFYSASLLAASISLIGCQTATIEPTVMSPYDNVRTMQAVVDLDGDGVLDDIDECPKTPANLVVDAKGCQTAVEVSGHEIPEFRAFYPENSSQPISFDYTDINELAELVIKHEKGVMLIEGHISKIEKDNKYETLATSRAEFIKNYVVSKYGIDPSRIVICPYSDNMPIATNDSPEGRAMNQRVYAHLRGGYINLPKIVNSFSFPISLELI